VISSERFHPVDLKVPDPDDEDRRVEREEPEEEEENGGVEVGSRGESRGCPSRGESREGVDEVGGEEGELVGDEGRDESEEDEEGEEVPRSEGGTRIGRTAKKEEEGILQ